MDDITALAGSSCARDQVTCMSPEIWVFDVNGDNAAAVEIRKCYLPP